MDQGGLITGTKAGGVKMTGKKRGYKWKDILRSIRKYEITR